MILKVKNVGNTDFSIFNFGINISGNKKIIKIESSSQDRQHEVRLNENVSFDNTNDEIDIELDPFNRQEEYTFRLFIGTVTNTEDEVIEVFKEDDFLITSKLPVTFTKIEKRENEIGWRNSFIAQIPGIIILLLFGAFFLREINRTYDVRIEQQKEFFQSVKDFSKGTTNTLDSFENIRETQIDSLQKVYQLIENSKVED